MALQERCLLKADMCIKIEIKGAIEGAFTLIKNLEIRNFKSIKSLDLNFLGLKGIKHEGGKGKVLERVKENPGAVGIIDEDPDSNQPSERYEYIEYERRSTIKFLVKKGDKSKKVIEISPDLEGWILARARKNRVSQSTMDFRMTPTSFILHIWRKIRISENFWMS